MSKLPVEVIEERMDDILLKLSDPELPHHCKKQYIDLYELNRKILEKIDPRNPKAKRRPINIVSENSQ